MVTSHKKVVSQDRVKVPQSVKSFFHAYFYLTLTLTKCQLIKTQSPSQSFSVRENKTKFERSSSLQYYHMTCAGKTKHTCKPKSSIVSATPRTFHLYRSLQFIQQILWFIVLQFIVHRNLMCKLLSMLVSYISCQYGMSTILQVISHKVSFFSGDSSLKLCSLLKR